MRTGTYIRSVSYMSCVVTGCTVVVATLFCSVLLFLCLKITFGLHEIIKCLVDNENAGDFGNENVDLVRDVSKLDLPKAAILGNHDCWQTVSPFSPYLSVSTTNFQIYNFLRLI